jgi:hypothetical protein
MDINITRIYIFNLKLIDTDLTRMYMYFLPLTQTQPTMNKNIINIKRHTISYNQLK